MPPRSPTSGRTLGPRPGPLARWREARSGLAPDRGYSSPGSSLLPVPRGLGVPDHDPIWVDVAVLAVGKPSNKPVQEAQNRLLSAGASPGGVRSALLE